MKASEDKSLLVHAEKSEARNNGNIRYRSNVSSDGCTIKGNGLTGRYLLMRQLSLKEWLIKCSCKVTVRENF